jgi:hypothetical protein
VAAQRASTGGSGAGRGRDVRSSDRGGASGGDRAHERRARWGRSVAGASSLGAGGAGGGRGRGRERRARWGRARPGAEPAGVGEKGAGEATGWA